VSTLAPAAIAVCSATAAGLAAVRQCYMQASLAIGHLSAHTISDLAAAAAAAAAGTSTRITVHSGLHWFLHSSVYSVLDWECYLAADSC